MKDFRGREVLIGSTVVYSLTGGLAVVNVVDVDGDKVTVSKEDGSNKTITWKENKAVLIHDAATLA